MEKAALSRNLSASTQDKSLFKQLTYDYNIAILQGSNYKNLIHGRVVSQKKEIGVDDLAEIYKILTKHGVQ